MIRRIPPEAAKRAVHDGGEIAFLDVREAGECAEGHPLFAAPCPYSGLEREVVRLAPRRGVRVVLIDGGDGVAERAAARLATLDYTNVAVVEGGAPSWAAAGFTLFEGVNVPSKTLGELAEQVWHPQTVDAATLARWRTEGRPFRLFDTRPADEYAKMRVPGAGWMPNGELAHRLPVAVPDSDTPVVVNCAGRTRSLTGAVGLALAGCPAPVVALENGTQGWELAGLALERGNLAPPLPPLDAAARETTRERARTMTTRWAIPVCGATEVGGWLTAGDRTAFLFDIRSDEEAWADPLPAATHVLGVTLVQASDRHVGVRRARIALADDLGLRGAIAAFWLRQLGFEVAVVPIDDALRTLPAPARPDPFTGVPEVAPVDAADASRAVRAGAAHLVDVRGSLAHRAGHPKSAIWSIRPRLARDVPADGRPVHGIGDAATVRLAALDLAAAGVREVRRVDGGVEAMAAAGHPIVATPDVPDERTAIDHVWFTHGRHDGDLEASRRYLAWELGLVARLDPDERAAFVLARRE